MLLKSFQALLLVAACAAPASAQFDRAKDSLRDVKSNYEQAVRSAESNDRDGATRSLAEVTKALGAMIDASRDVPSQLNDGELSALGTKAKYFLEAAILFRNVTATLSEKVGRVGESYSSELSTFKDKYGEFDRTYNDFNGSILRAAGALRRACPGCLNN